jgi:hypothetical protein
MRKVNSALLLVLLLLLAPFLWAVPLPIHAQQEYDLVASLERLEGGVSVLRFDAADFLVVNRESLVGVGDTIRTDSTGRARITFFANGSDTEVLPGSTFRIDEFKGAEDQYQLSVTILLGQTRQRVSKLLDSGSSYKINSTGLELAVRGTAFAVRVEQSGRSALLVGEGAVDAKNAGGSAEAAVPAGFGVRAEAGEGLSDVVRASTFAQLDAALDGCGALIQTIGDVRLNVRVGPGLAFQRVGRLENNVRQLILGVTETTQWYRVPFQGGFAWLYSPALILDSSCAGLRRFPDNWPGEDTSRYRDLEPGITVTPNAPPPSTPYMGPTLPSTSLTPTPRP